MKIAIIVKDGSRNFMISAHPTEQIFTHLVICPCCSMGEESIVVHQAHIPTSYVALNPMISDHLHG